eukprot:109443-Rhodomonas_salina.3
MCAARAIGRGGTREGMEERVRERATGSLAASIELVTASVAPIDNVQYGLHALQKLFPLYRTLLQDRGPYSRRRRTRQPRPAKFETCWQAVSMGKKLGRKPQCRQITVLTCG